MFRIAIVVTALLVAGVVHPAVSHAQGPSRAAASRSTAPVMVNLNTASAADLEALPGIGAKTAARIVEYRQKNGPFKKIEELMNVRGIGEKNFLKLKASITVAAPKPERASQQ